MLIKLQFNQCTDDDGKLELWSKFTCISFGKPVKDIRVKINLSIDNEDDIAEEYKWNEFNFKFRHELGETNKVIRFDTDRAPDVKKLLTSNAKILGKLSIYIKLSNEYHFKKRFLEEINLIPEVNESKDEKTHLSISFKSMRMLLDKDLLMRISPVFKAMLENPENKEAQENNMVVEEKDVYTMKRFGALLKYEAYFPSFNPTPTNPNPLLDLLLLADKYDIKSLFKICTQHIGDNLASENVLKVLKVSDMVNNEKLFAKAMKHFLASKEKEMQECLLRHPEMIAEMMDLVFDSLILDN